MRRINEKGILGNTVCSKKCGREREIEMEVPEGGVEKEDMMVAGNMGVLVLAFWISLSMMLLPSHPLASIQPND